MSPEELQAVQWILAAIFILIGTCVGCFFWGWFK